MRNPKFRAYDNKKGEWVDGYKGFHILGEMMLMDTFREYGLENLNDIVITQCTGLVDMEGTDIYDGDIVTINYGIPLTTDTLLIEYRDDQVVFGICVSGWWMSNLDKNGHSSSLCKAFEPDLRVIGNIFDNPEFNPTGGEE